MSESEVVSRKRGSNEPIICKTCNFSFTLQRSLNIHIRKFHPDQDVIVKGNQICGLCHVAFRTISLLQEHIQNQHSVNLQFVNETFYCQNDFLEWKKKVEKDSQSSFVLRNSLKKGMGRQLSYYICHRSGQFKPKEDRRRSIKACVTVKSGSTCPSVMKVSTETVDGISEIKVLYQTVHVGHDLEIRKLRFTKDERKNLATLLNFGIPMTKILEETKQNFSSTSRYSCITRKDLHNVIRDFGIKINNEETHQSNSGKHSNAFYEDIVICEGDVIYEDAVVIEDTNSNEIYNVEVNNHEEHQEFPENGIVSSLLKSTFEDFNNRKIKILDQLKDLQLTIQKWEQSVPLPDVEEYIKAMKGCFDTATASSSHLQKSLTKVSNTSPTKCVRQHQKHQTNRKC